jgi:RND family efflux transporter MFP subunit
MKPVRWLLLLVLLSSTIVGCRPRSKTKPPRAVRIELIVPTTQASTARYSGTVFAQTQVDLAFKIGGYVQSISPLGGEPAAEKAPATKAEKRAIAAHAKAAKAGRPLQAGDPVTRGMVLAALRKEDFKQKYAELAGMSAETAAGYRKAKQDFDRAKQLHAENAISQAELDAARSRYDGYAGATTAAAARAGQANIALSDSQLRSPLDGIILDRRIEVGALVPAGAPAFIIADTTIVRVVFGVPDSVQHTLAQGQAITVAVDAVPDRVFSAAITKIAAQADPRTRAFDIEASIDNADGLLKVGMIASIQLGRLQEAPAVQIPLSAVVRSPDNPQTFAVFVLGDGDRVARVRPIELGNLIGNRVSVTRGLTAGDRIVIQGATLLRDNDPVNVVPGAVQGPVVLGPSTAAPGPSR